MEYDNIQKRETHELIYTEYEDEFRSVAVIEDPELLDAWLLSTHYVPIEQ
ncbi:MULTISPECIES: hypothetical protein [unclassified Haladaptatus]|nr:MULTISPECIES: hypothetical protein [unclassified Haladaptatus]